MRTYGEAHSRWVEAGVGNHLYLAGVVTLKESDTCTPSRPAGWARPTHNFSECREDAEASLNTQSGNSR